MELDQLRRRWHPETETELREAYDLGLLEERSWCDLKREVESTDGARKELARDLASFAIDGGTLVIGLDEKASNGNPFHPVPLANFAERVERIALDRIDPPLIVTCTPIESDSNPTEGYLLVHVPVSAMAPHQVGGVYYGRGDKTKRALPDPEVQRLFARRAQLARGVEDILRASMKDESFGSAGEHGHLFVIAQPVGGKPEMFQALVTAPDVQLKLNDAKKLVITNTKLIESLRLTFPNQQVELDFAHMFTVRKTARGVLLTSRGVNMAYDNPFEAATLDAEIYEDGGLRFFYGGAVRNARRQKSDGGRPPEMYLVPITIFVYTCLLFVAELSHLAGYESMWDFGVGITETKDAYGVAPLRGISPPQVRWDESTYERTTRASVAELDQAAASITGRLMGRLIRTFSAEVTLQHFLTSLRPPQT